MAQELSAFRNSNTASKQKKLLSFHIIIYFNNKVFPQFILKYTSQCIFTHLKYPISLLLNKACLKLGGRLQESGGVGGGKGMLICADYHSISGVKEYVFRCPFYYSLNLHSLFHGLYA